jgi:hypothetical protein
MYSDDGTQATCPYCGNTFSYTQNDLNHDGTVACRGCGSIIETKRQPMARQGQPSPSHDPIFSQGTRSRTSGSTSSSATVRKSGTSGTSVACGIILVLLFLPLIIAIPVAICIGLWYMSKNKETTTSSSSSSTTSSPW